MSASRRRPRPDSRADQPPPEDGELPELEPLPEAGSAAPSELPGLPELPELEPEPDAAGVQVACLPAAEPGFDTLLQVTVPAMDKATVLQSVREPLRRAVAQHRGAIRHRRVLVRFAGEALIGSAVRDLVGGLLASSGSILGVVRRGYGDEKVNEGKAPELGVRCDTAGERLRVEIDAGGFEPGDLDTLLLSGLGAVLSSAAGKHVELQLTAGPVPGRTLRLAIANALRKAGAVRATLDGKLLFDAAIERLVQLDQSGEETTLTIRSAGEEDVLAALATVPAESIAGRRVVVRAEGGEPQARVLERLVELGARGNAARVEFDGSAAGRDVLLPRLLEVVRDGGRTVLRVHPEGRSAALLAAAFRREATALRQDIAGRAVTVDWPAGTILDATIERDCLEPALLPLAPASVSCSFGGDQDEPFHPPPVRIARRPDGVTEVRLDTDAGRPAGLARVLQRRLLEAGELLRGRRVEASVQGQTALSRTLLRVLREACAAHGAARLVLDDHGRRDVILPPLLAVRVDGDSVQIDGDAGGRDDAELLAALERELEASALPPGAAYAIAMVPFADRLVAAAIARGASRVVLTGDEPVQVHPALFGGAEREGDRLVLFVDPGDEEALLLPQVRRELPALLQAQGDLAGAAVTLSWPGAVVDSPAVAAAVQLVLARRPARLSLDDGNGPRQLHPEVAPDYVTVLGRKDDAGPPLVMLGVDAGAGEDHAARVRQKLGELQSLVAGRRVLLVVRDHGRDVATADDDALLLSARAAVEPTAAATLVFSGRDAQRRPFFTVVHSTLDALPVGTRCADPRPRAARTG